MLVTAGPVRYSVRYGVTIWSYWVVITVYCTPGTVSPPAFSEVRNGEPTTCWVHAWQSALMRFAAHVMCWSWGTRPLRSVPWLDGVRPTRALTLAAPPRF